MFCCVAPSDNEADEIAPRYGAVADNEDTPIVGKGKGKGKKGKATGKSRGMPRGPTITAPDPGEEPFMKTACPNGMSWAQYVETQPSFVDQRGFLSGPFGECIAWGVVFEHANDWESIPEYSRDGVVGGILKSLEKKCKGDGSIMEAASKLEEASHALADRGEPLPAIQQAVTLPANAVPGQQCQIPHPQMPGSYQTITVPPNGKPGQPIAVNAPVQPTQTGKTGMSTGSKVAFAAGGVVAAGAVAGVAYYATVGGGWDGFTSDMGTAGDWAEGAAGDAGDWASGAAADVGAWGEGVAADPGGWAEGAVSDVGAWGEGAVSDVGAWGEGAAADVGAWGEGVAADPGAWAGGAVSDVGAWGEGAGASIGEWSTGAVDDVGGFVMNLF